ncbi:hypothetical protein PC9H_010841 [Pleurotus ostreatus]|uniref:Uncharacterized protein n=1 Tax=Pleurotus ostreatus TaxID=5322 RepID=A0A8H7DQ35_PLEOS|nr:uncharacterized protein PC9H_010841 [Pleurotus ostreatus]KAF7422685.1 hypothetical protein PC9H_010841 [Pleurotus ostreatus]KAJ8691425.1 hypothetical protein PTI98_010997 [Pleurotus ostreatus]
MGRSAKVHKRVTKKTKGGASNKAVPAQGAHVHLQTSKKKATLKDRKVNKAKSGNGGGASGVLGGADYVTLLMGGRRKAMEEAQKLPQSED